MKNNTWQLVQLPRNSSLIKSRWTFKMKPGYKNQEDIYKARFVAKDFSQVAGIDYNESEIYAPVVKHDSSDFTINHSRSGSWALSIFSTFSLSEFGSTMAWSSARHNLRVEISSHISNNTLRWFQDRFIGLEISRDRPQRKLYITQSNYVQKLIKKNSHGRLQHIWCASRSMFSSLLCKLSKQRQLDLW